MTTRKNTATGASTVSRKFTKIVSDLPKYGSGTITSAYLLEDGCVVGYCKDTKEWLKWNSKGQLHTSCGWSREDAAMLFTDERGSWCDLDPENGKIVADARTKPTHSERVRSIRAKRDARIARKRSERQRRLQNPEAHEVATAHITPAVAQADAQSDAGERCSCGAIVPELCKTFGHLEPKRLLLDLLNPNTSEASAFFQAALGQQNFRARYFNMTAITGAGSYIATQHWCSSNDDIAALEKRILAWDNDAIIVRVFVFDTFTRVLHELAIDHAARKLVRCKPRIEALS